MITEQITQVIDKIAEKLGIAAEAVYPMLLTQATIDVSLYRITLWILVISALVFVPALIGALWACGDWRREKVMTACTALCFVAGFVAFTSGFIVLLDLKEYLTALHNPDLWCIEYVATMLK